MKASDIERVLSAVITFGKKIINMSESDYKSELAAIFNLVTSHMGNTDAESSAETVREFLADVKVEDLESYQFAITDNVKTVTFNGQTLSILASIWGLASTDWHVERGGKRQNQQKPAAKLANLK